MNSFKYPDTNSSRARIEDLNYKIKNQKIAIIGLGGTGSYILDLISKTPLKEIHIYDGDIFKLHNAFRAPGAISGAMLDMGIDLMKVQYYFETYSKMHNNIIPHPEYMTKSNIQELFGFDFVFISVDNNEARSIIIECLLSMKIDFIDVGLGVDRVEDKLIGSLRVTAGTKIKQDHLRNRIGAMEVGQNEYSTNIQIAELNCLNAALAVIKWKKICGFYQDLKNEHNLLYFINTNKILNEDLPI
jgi:tRNA A37 threonylcarbamoyladenosine dehydratase